MVCVSSTFAFATETTLKELKNCSKTKTLRKALVFGSLFGVEKKITDEIEN